MRNGNGVAAAISFVAVLTGGEAGATVPPAPPSPYGPMLVSWSVEAVRCGDAQPVIVRTPDPSPALSYGMPDRPAALTVRFRIGADGRPLGIARVGTDYVPDSDDLLPSLAVARFASGAAQPDCTLRFVATRQPLATAPVEEAWRYSVAPQGTPPGELWARVWAGGGDCTNPNPAPLMTAWPDYKAMHGRPGMRDWVMMKYDLDGRGRPANVRVAAGTANAELVAAGLKAVRTSRFEKAARTGCLTPFSRNPDRLEPPEPPSEDSLRPTGATCPRDLPYVRQPTLTFPEAYRKRSIEGWAVLAFDVAPWGALGNVRVLAAEPSADFGEWAKNVIGNATKAPSNTGYVGCVDRVIFRIGPVPKLIVTDLPVVS